MQTLSANLIWSKKNGIGCIPNTIQSNHKQIMMILQRSQPSGSQRTPRSKMHGYSSRQQECGSLQLIVASDKYLRKRCSLNNSFPDSQVSIPLSGQSLTPSLTLQSKTSFTS